MITHAQCPASCGELLLGCFKNDEKLISCPVDKYNKVQIVAGSPNNYECEPMRRALLETLRYFNIDEQIASKLRLTIQHGIPIGRGMGSRSATIFATIQATARWMNIELTIDELVDIATNVEPVNSTAFPSLTLFSYLTGASYSSHGNSPLMDVLILECSQPRNHQRLRLTPSYSEEHEINIAHSRLQAGCQKHDPFMVGEASTISAIISHRQSLWPEFNKLLKLVEQQNYHGLCLSHYGNIISILFDQRQQLPEQILSQLKQLGILSAYPIQYLARAISGGVI